MKWPSRKTGERCGYLRLAYFTEWHQELIKQLGRLTIPHKLWTECTSTTRLEVAHLSWYHGNGAWSWPDNWHAEQASCMILVKLWITKWKVAHVEIRCKMLRKNMEKMRQLLMLLMSHHGDVPANNVLFQSVVAAGRWRYIRC